MSGTILDGAKNYMSSGEQKAFEQQEEQTNEQPQEETATTSTGEGFMQKVITALKTPSSSTPVENYKSHAFNPSGSDGKARMLKGLSDILGNFDYALVHVIFGFQAWKGEKKSDTVRTEDTSESNRYDANGKNNNGL